MSGASYLAARSAGSKLTQIAVQFQALLSHRNLVLNSAEAA